MAILVGIDEAGFGPILGPLVVSSSMFSMPDNLLNSDLWQLLRKSASNSRKHISGRLLIADSKKAFIRSQGIKNIQRTVLACLNCLEKNPSSLNDLLMLLCPNCCQRLKNYPWYKNTQDYSLSYDHADLSIASEVFKDNLISNDIKLLELKSYCLDVAYYNKMVNTVRNKANVLFSATSMLIKHAFDNFDDDQIQVIIDRQGGRIHYRKKLLTMFENMDLKIIQQTPNNSSYELQANGKKMRLHFVVKADNRFLPVSLASMVSKYLRELLIDNINHYFRNFHSDLKPTAGYWKDGLRFIQDIKKHLPHLNYNADQLIRSR